ncbi:MAG: NYN domain-containing protein [Chloroflexi bacterium]|nr:NYN domain-containing protein [Chloroflexota bacterium]MCY3939038.1 NYN domain-containing protein [Chloroflexota bacterium]
MRTSGTTANVYVDGFNLYYRAVRGTPWRWLDIQSLANQLLGAKFKLHRIRYFTARIKTRGNDRRKHLRQQVYLRALNTISELVIHEGHFLSNAVWMPLASPRPGQSSLVEVIRTEEKGSDANLAAWLTRDAAKRDCQAAFVVTGDSDFAGVIQMVRQEFSFPVHVIDPAGASSSRLRGTATTYNPLNRKLLPLCQFPSRLTDRSGRAITKPREWD